MRWRDATGFAPKSKAGRSAGIRPVISGHDPASVRENSDVGVVVVLGVLGDVVGGRVVGRVATDCESTAHESVVYSLKIVLKLGPSARHADSNARARCSIAGPTAKLRLERRCSIEPNHTQTPLTVLPSLGLVNADIVDAHLGREDKVVEVDKAKVLRHAVCSNKQHGQRPVTRRKP